MRWRSTALVVLVAALMLPDLAANASSIQKIWSYNPPNRSWVTSSGAELDGLVFVLNRRLYAPTGSVSALDETTGLARWTVAMTGLAPTDRPLIAGNQVLIGTGEGVTALDPTSGEALWHADWPCGSQVDIATARVAYAVTGQICKLNLRTQRVRLLHRNPFGGDDGWDLLVLGGRLVVSYPNNGVVVFSGRSGKILWRVYGGPYTQGDAIGLALDGGLLLVGKQAIDLSTHQVAQGWDPSGIRSLVTSAGVVTEDEVIFAVVGEPGCSPGMCGSEVLSLEAVDPVSGSIIWDSQVASGASTFAAPIVNGGTIYVNTVAPDGTSHLVAVDARIGAIGESLAAPPAYSGFGSDFTSPFFMAGSAVSVNGLHRLAAYG